MSERLGPAGVGDGIDLDALTRYLRDALPGGVAGPLRATRLAGGSSTPTHLLTDGVDRWVLRRPTAGPADDPGREFRVLTALAGTDVPVPAPLLAGDPDVLGAPFHLLAYVPGAVVRTAADVDRVLPTPADVRTVTTALVDVLARLHSIDPAAVGLADLGGPPGRLGRQLARWQRRLDGVRSRELPGMDDLISSLAATLPVTDGRPAVLHGDYKLDNLVLDPVGRIAAVLDWETAELGDPLVDLGLAVAFYDAFPAVVDRPDLTVRGGLSAAEMIHRYAGATGAEVAGMTWYIGFGLFTIAVICEGLHHRRVRGGPADDGARPGDGTPLLVERARATLARLSRA